MQFRKNLRMSWNKLRFAAIALSSRSHRPMSCGENWKGNNITIRSGGCRLCDVNHSQRFGSPIGWRDRKQNRGRCGGWNGNECASCIRHRGQLTTTGHSQKYLSSKPCGCNIYISRQWDTRIHKTFSRNNQLPVTRRQTSKTCASRMT